MRKVKRVLAYVLSLCIISSLLTFNVSALEEPTVGENVLVDIDFTKMTDTSDLNNLENVEFSGLYEVADAPDGTRTLKLCKDGVDGSIDGDTATPGTMKVKLNNGRAQGEYKFQLELYMTGVRKKLMQNPIIFMDIKDTAYNNGEGLDITRISYDEERYSEVKGRDVIRVYANLLAGIEETSGDNHIASNTDGETVNKWFSITSTVNTTLGECTAVASIKSSQQLSRSFEDSDPDVVGNFAPNEVTTIASASNSAHENDMYIKRVLITGPEGEPTPIVPVAPPDYEITALNLTDASGVAAELGTATKIDSITVNRASHIEDKEYTVLVVEYKDNVFSRLHIKKYEPAEATTEGDISLQLSPQTYEENTITFDEELSEGTTSVKVMLWNNFNDLAPIAKVYK